MNPEVLADLLSYSISKDILNYKKDYIWLQC